MAHEKLKKIKIWRERYLPSDLKPGKKGYNGRLNVIRLDVENGKPKNQKIKEVVEYTFGSDVARPIKGSSKLDKNQAFEKVAKEINNLFDNNSQDFDSWHSETCEELRTILNNNESDIKVKYGIAQKLLNMTLKNMLALGLWDDEFSGLIKFLHVPVDSFIMEAASVEFDIKIPLQNTGTKEKDIYGYNKSKKWSNWDIDDYKEFQDDLCKKLKNSGLTRIEWEFRSWDIVRHKRSSKCSSCQSCIDAFNDIVEEYNKNTPELEWHNKMIKTEKCGEPVWAQNKKA